MCSADIPENGKVLVELLSEAVELLESIFLVG